MTDLVEITDQYDVGYDDGYEAGVETGTESTTERYDTIIQQIDKEHEEIIDYLQTEHELKIEREIRTAIEVEQEKFDSKLSELQQNMENMILNFQSTIKQLKEENYALRKENATITRSIQKSS